MQQKWRSHCESVEYLSVSSWRATGQEIVFFSDPGPRLFLLNPPTEAAGGGSGGTCECGCGYKLSQLEPRAGGWTGGVCHECGYKLTPGGLPPPHSQAGGWTGGACCECEYRLTPGGLPPPHSQAGGWRGAVCECGYKSSLSGPALNPQAEGEQGGGVHEGKAWNQSEVPEWP